MALLYLDAAGKIQCTTDGNPRRKDSWVWVPDAVWVAAQYNNDNKLVNGELVTNHITDYTQVEKEERDLRDALLRDSDWSVLPDAPLTEAKKVEWTVYRQALRDIPQQPGFPDFVVIPEAPSKE